MIDKQASCAPGRRAAGPRGCVCPPGSRPCSADGVRKAEASWIPVCPSKGSSHEDEDEALCAASGELNPPSRVLSCPPYWALEVAPVVTKLGPQARCGCRTGSEPGSPGGVGNAALPASAWGSQAAPVNASLCA